MRSTLNGTASSTPGKQTQPTATNQASKRRRVDPDLSDVFSRTFVTPPNHQAFSAPLLQGLNPPAGSAINPFVKLRLDLQNYRCFATEVDLIEKHICSQGKIPGYSFSADERNYIRDRCTELKEILSNTGEQNKILAKVHVIDLQETRDEHRTIKEKIEEICQRFRPDDFEPRYLEALVRCATEHGIDLAAT